MNIVYVITALFKGVLLKLFPSLGYQGVVNTQINLYNKAKGKMPEQEILNRLILGRIAVSFREKEEAEKAYGHLINDDNKTLEDVIKAIANYEYFESADSKAKISRIPQESVQEYKKECMEYIEKKCRECNMGKKLNKENYPRQFSKPTSTERVNAQREAMAVLKKLVVCGGDTLAGSDEELLRKKPGTAMEHKGRMGKIYETAFNGFFHCATEGQTFVPEERIKETYGNSLKDNYPEANNSFLDFAKTYWTLKILVTSLYEDMDWIGANIILQIERDIGSVFFPHPGPAEIYYKKREKTQRELIESSGAKIDIDEFVKGNSILLRDKTRQKGLYWKIFKKKGFWLP